MRYYFSDKIIVGLLILIFITGVLLIVEFKRIGEQPKPILTYYFKNPQLVDPIKNATQDLYLTGELEVGRCYKYENN